MGRIESLGCHVEGDTVYVYDQDGNNIDSFLLDPYAENVYPSGRSVIVETPSDIYIYSLRGGHMERTGSKLKPPKHNMGKRRGGSSDEDDVVPASTSVSHGGCGLWIGIILGALIINQVYVHFFADSEAEEDGTLSQTVSTARASRHSGARKYIKEFIDEQGGCRIAAITKKGAAVAISHKSNWAHCNGCPSGLVKVVKDIDKKSYRINDVCLTESGKWVVVFGGNGVRQEGIPQAMQDALVQYNDNNEEIYCAALNDSGDWVVISDKHYSSASTGIQNWLNEIPREYGELLYVSLTDDAKIAVYEGGYSYVGNYPKDMRKALKKSDFKPKVVKMAGDSWFFADATGSRCHYSM